MNFIKSVVELYKRKFKTSNPFDLADYLNCIIVETDLDASVRGFYQYHKRNKIIYLNNNLSESDKFIVCAHELGHSVLHTKDNIYFIQNYTLFGKNKYEREANIFAAELLIPDDSLKYLNEYTIYQTASILNVPIELLRLKINIDK